MVSESLRGLSFRTSAGETVRVHDCICWRHLEGRPCRTAQERQAAQSIDVVIIPVIPSGQGSSKRARKAETISTAAAPSSAAVSKGDSGGGAAGIDRDGLLIWCAAARAALDAAGLRAVVDDCPRQTPGAKYHAWENRGVALRVEVGSREAASRTLCLALHPRLTHLMPLATAAAAPPPPASTSELRGVAVAEGGHQGGVPGSQDRTPAAAVADGRAGGRASVRLGGLSPEQAAAACLAVVAGAQATTGAVGGGVESGGGGATPGVPVPGSGDVADALSVTATAAAAGSQWCGKLHLWPELVEAWGSTESSVAALLAELAAAAGAAASAVQSVGGGGGGVDANFSDAATAADKGGRSVAVLPTSGAQGGRPDRPCGSGGGERPMGQRPCVTHLRHLLQLGRPCYCGRGHYNLQQLQAEVEGRLKQGRSGGGCSGEGQQPQAAVVEWITPALPSARKQQQHQQQQRQGKGPDAASNRAAPRRCGKVTVPTDDEEGDAEEGMDGDDVGSEDGRSVAGDGDSVGDRMDGGGYGGRVVLLVGNIPSAVRASVVQGELAAAFALYGCCGVAVSRTRSGGSHGWARVSLAAAAAAPPGEETAAALATAAVAALDGQLRLGGAALTVSYSSGRLDTIFPYLPYIVRSAMRVDSTAAFSATDQATADKMTDLLAELVERLVIPPPPPLTAPPPVSDGGAAGGRLAAAPERAEAISQLQLPLLLPLVLTDGTACCGGNSLSFARRFRRVVAVELDPDRAEDLRHNAALVRAWDDFRRGGERRCDDAPGTADTDDGALPDAQRLSNQELGPLEPPSSSRGQLVPVPAADGVAHKVNDAATGGSMAGSSCGGGGGDGPPPEAGGGPQQEACGLGALEVVCGDYTELIKSLRQDVVFMDPPWGGPQYCGATTGPAPAPAPAGRPTAGWGGAAAGPSGRSVTSGGGGAMAYGDTAFMLGREPLSYMVSELLAGGGAGMVALKLPSRADAELRAMQARVRQLVAARLRDRGGGGGGARDAVAATGGVSGDPRACRPRLLGAEVTLGRSALVIFMLLPYDYGCRTPGASVGGAPLHCSGICPGSAGVAPAAAAAAAGGACGARRASDGPTAPQPSLDSDGAEEEDGDASEDEEAERREGGRGRSGVDGGGPRTAGALRRGAASGGCPACAGLGAAFRAALRESCSRLGLPYRLVCE